jgi:DNA polymerase-3 subunit epsilon
LVAHNVATERGILAKAFPLHPFGPWVDTLALSRKAWRGLESYALEDLLKRFGLSGYVAEYCPGLESHDALYDAVGAGVLLEYLLNQEGWEKLRIGDGLL